MERNLVKAVIVLSSDGVYEIWTCFFVPAACGREASFALEFLFPFSLPVVFPGLCDGFVLIDVHTAPLFDIIRFSSPFSSYYSLFRSSMYDCTLIAFKTSRITSTLDWMSIILQAQIFRQRLRPCHDWQIY